MVGIEEGGDEPLVTVEIAEDGAQAQELGRIDGGRPGMFAGGVEQRVRGGLSAGTVGNPATNRADLEARSTGLRLA